MAVTADGKIATANRAVSTFGSSRDHEHLLELRATADAVMAGARTVDSAKVNLGPGAAKFRRMRLRHGLAEFNLRVVVTGSGTVDPRAEIFRHRFSPIIVLTSRRASAARLKTLRRIADDVHVSGGNGVNVRAALRWLARKWGVRRLLCEGGAELNDAMFRAKVVREIHLTMCPLLFGGAKAPTISEGRGFATLAEAARFRLKSMKRHGGELFAVFQLRTGKGGQN